MDINYISLIISVLASVLAILSLLKEWTGAAWHYARMNWFTRHLAGYVVGFLRAAVTERDRLDALRMCASHCDKLDDCDLAEVWSLVHCYWESHEAASGMLELFAALEANQHTSLRALRTLSSVVYRNPRCSVSIVQALKRFLMSTEIAVLSAAQDNTIVSQAFVALKRKRLDREELQIFEAADIATLALQLTPETAVPLFAILEICLLMSDTRDLSHNYSVTHCNSAIFHLNTFLTDRNIGNAIFDVASHIVQYFSICKVRDHRLFLTPTVREAMREVEGTREPGHWYIM